MAYVRYNPKKLFVPQTLKMVAPPLWTGRTDGWTDRQTDRRMGMMQSVVCTISQQSHTSLVNRQKIRGIL